MLSVCERLDLLQSLINAARVFVHEQRVSLEGLRDKLGVLGLDRDKAQSGDLSEAQADAHEQKERPRQCRGKKRKGGLKSKQPRQPAPAKRFDGDTEWPSDLVMDFNDAVPAVKSLASAIMNGHKLVVNDTNGAKVGYRAIRGGYEVEGYCPGFGRRKTFVSPRPNLSIEEQLVRELKQVEVELTHALVDLKTHLGI